MDSCQADRPCLGECWISGTVAFAGSSKQDSSIAKVMYSTHLGQYQLSRQATGLLPPVGMRVDLVHAPSLNHCVMRPKHGADVPVRMSSDGTPHPPSNWAIEPRILEPEVMAAWMLLSDSHQEPVAPVCNYSRTPYTFKADSFLGLAELVIHVTSADSKAAGSSLTTDNELNVPEQPDMST